MRDKFFVVVSYDIRDERRLNKIAHIMTDYGHRVLYSVFECYLEKDIFERMRQRVEEVMDIEDSVIYYFLCADCRKKIEHIGRTPFYLKEEEISIV